MTLSLLLVVPVVLFALWRKRRRRAAALATPLAGLDTGCRSPFRTPARHFRPHRGF
jgi:hypothetical protein